jgi:hypothetical protein
MSNEIKAPEPAVLAGQELTNAERAADTARANASEDGKATKDDLGVDKSLTPTQVEMAQTAAAEESAPDDRPGLDTSGAEAEEEAVKRAEDERKAVEKATKETNAAAEREAAKDAKR